MWFWLNCIFANFTLYKMYHLQKSCVSVIAAISFLFLGLQACKKADINFGDEFLNNPNTQVVKVDTFTAALSTVVLDSFSTNATGGVMVGGYDDLPNFGKLTTQSYMQIAPPAFQNASVYAGALFDSITLRVKIKNFYGDSTKNFNIQVHELNEKITIPEESVSIFNHKTLAVKPTALANENRILRPRTSPNLSIKLDNTLGQNWLNKLKNPNDNDIKTDAAFLEYFKGIRLSTNNTNSMAVSFTDSVIIRIHYKVSDFILVEKTVDFNLVNNVNQFNNVEVRRVGTPLQAFSSTVKELPSTATNNVSYLQSSTGVLTKISFPSIENILKLPNYTKLIRATLLVRPVTGTYSTSLFLPPALRLSTTTSANDIGPDLVGFASNGSSFVQLGDLQTDYFLGVNTRYQYDVTDYVKLLISNPTYPRRSVLLVPQSPAFSTSFARAIFGNKQHLENKIELQLFYITVR